MNVGRYLRGEDRHVGTARVTHTPKLTPAQRESWVPETPGGSVLMHLESRTEEEAWRKLLKETAHMPYGTKAALIRRGYTVTKWETK